MKKLAIFPVFALTALLCTLTASAESAIHSAALRGDAVAVNVTADADCALTVALYDAEGRLLDVQTRDVAATAGGDISVTIPGGIPEGSAAKAFLTDAGHKPLCEAVDADADGGDTPTPDPTPTPATEDVYAILYADGTLVFQRGDTPESGREVRETFAVDMDSHSSPSWYDARRFIIQVDFADAIQPTSTAYWFYECTKLQEISHIENLDTSHVTDMQEMFDYCRALTALDLGAFHTANVTKMNFMFSGCSALTALNLRAFDIANVTDMGSMFSGCYALTALDLSSFNTANVTDMGGMFSGCYALATLDLSSFNTANVTDMHSMFSGCGALTTLDLRAFDTANVTDMHSMFYGCGALTALDLRAFDTANVTDMHSMFYGCGALTALDLSAFDTANVTDVREMFSGCGALTTLNLSGFNTTNVTDMGSMFSGCSALTTLDVSDFHTDHVAEMGWMFSSCYGLTTIYASEHFVTSQVLSSSNMFSDCSFLTGGASTTYGENYTDKEYARIDGGAAAPGYFTAK